MLTSTHSWVITGGAGFIGSNLAKYLVSHGQRVTVVDDFSAGCRENILSFQDRIRVIQADIRQASSLKEAFAGADFVLHHAALVSVPLSVQDPRTTWEINVLGTACVLEAAKRAGVKRVVLASSCSVYGASSVSSSEQTSLNPASPYAVSKHLGESLCRYYTDTQDLETVILRYFNVYGEGQSLQGPYSAVIAKFMDLIARGKELPIEWDGRQTRDFVSVEDVCRANVVAAFRALPGEAYNVASGKSYSLLELVSFLEQISGQVTKRCFKPKRAGDVKTSAADIQKISQLGFSPEISLVAGLKKMWDSSSFSSRKN